MKCRNRKTVFRFARRSEAGYLWVALLALLIVLVLPGATFAKATRHKWRIDNLPVKFIDSHASTGWGDTDVNIVIMPDDTLRGSADPRERAQYLADRDRFFASFWWPWNRLRHVSLSDYLSATHDTWRLWLDLWDIWLPDRYLADSFFSQRCIECAGKTDRGIYCELDPARIYQTHPCPDLFACRDCLGDLVEKRHINYGGLSPNVELYVGSPEEDNSNALTSLSGNVMGLDDPFFREPISLLVGSSDYKCNDRTLPVPGSICGQSGFVSGVFTLEEQHGYTPELHPLSTVMVKKNESPTETEWIVGAFLDGSTEEGGVQQIWTTNYRFLSEDLYPSSPELKLSLLDKVKRPPAGRLLEDGSFASGQGVEMEQYCDVLPVYSRNARSVDLPPGFRFLGGYGNEPRNPAGPCRDIKVNLIRTGEQSKGGAAWVARVKTGWRKKLLVELAASATLEAGNTGLGVVPPSATITPVTAAGSTTGNDPLRASPSFRAATRLGGATAVPRVAPVGKLGEAERCEVTALRGPGRSEAAIRRWHKWTIRTNTRLLANGLTWNWYFPDGVAGVLPRPIPREVPSGEFVFDVWIGTRPNESSVNRYQRKVMVDVFNGNTKVLTETLTLTLPRPFVRINRVDSSGFDGANHSFTVVANTGGLCGGAKYKWFGNEVLVPSATGAGPHQFRVPPDGGAIGVIATDAYGAETAHDVIAVRPPGLTVDIVPTCVLGARRQDAKGAILNVRGGRVLGGKWQPPSQPYRRSADVADQACERVRFVAEATDGGDEDDPFLETNLDGLTVQWSDLKYLSRATNGAWVDIPRGWKEFAQVKHPDDTLAVTPSPRGIIRLAAAVTVSDRWGRRAVATIDYWTIDFEPGSGATFLADLLGYSAPSADSRMPGRGTGVAGYLRTLAAIERDVKPGDAKARRHFRDATLDVLFAEGPRTGRVTLPAGPPPTYAVNRAAAPSGRALRAAARERFASVLARNTAIRSKPSEQTDEAPETVVLEPSENDAAMACSAASDARRSGATPLLLPFVILAAAVLVVARSRSARTRRPHRR